MPALTADLRRRFRTGRPSLDLAHTGGEGEAARWEIVHGVADLERLLALILGVPQVRTTAADLAAMRPLRDAIARIARGLAAGVPMRAADVEILNAAATGSPLVPALLPAGGTAVVDPTAAAALATLARDAIDLFGGPRVARIRVCAAADCGLLFVDASRPGRRRWCSMERCGNRAKVRGHRARHPAD